MLDFQKLEPARRGEYLPYLMENDRKCEYSFVNLSIWGRQRVAFADGFLVIFSQFDRKAVYPFPMGRGDVVPVLEAIMADARDRGIPCCLTGLGQAQKDLLEAHFPGKFRFYADRDTFDYIYDIHALADLKGKKLQKKRNHLNKFRAQYPDWQAEVLTPANLPAVQAMAAVWYDQRLEKYPDMDLHLEKLALDRALRDPFSLGLAGMVLRVEGQVAAFTMGSLLTADTFDIHFEKALDQYDGAYPAINQAFSSYLRDAHPQLRYLNREDDLGLEGLRKAKLSYCPAFLSEKYWARLWEDLDEA